jgi:hypothetical protein
MIFCNGAAHHCYMPCTATQIGIKQARIQAEAKRRAAEFQADLSRLRDAVTAVENDSAARYARLRKHCTCFCVSVTTRYMTAADMDQGVASSANLRVSALTPGRRYIDLLYSIDLDPTDPILDSFADWRGGESNENTHWDAAILDGRLVQALWPDGATWARSLGRFALQV